MIDRGGARAPYAILILFLLIYLAPLALRPLSAPDEYRYGEVPREMIASGDWIVPRLNGMPYFEKPVLGYWLIALSILAFGRNAFALRLPSALAAGATAAVIYFLFRRIGRDRRDAALAAAAYLTSLLPFVLGVTAILDSVFTFFVTATSVGLFLAAREEGATRRRLLAAAGVAAGGAFLTKGPLGWIFPLLAVAPWLLLTGRTRRFLRAAWLPALAAVVVSAPWAIAIQLRSDFWRRFIWVEHIQRFAEAGRDQHAAGAWYYLAYLIPAALPWIFLLPGTVGPLRRAWAGAEKDLVVFAACWFAFPFLLISASSGKLLSYLLPCIPPLIILLIAGATSPEKEPSANGAPGAGRARLAGWLSASAGALLLAASFTVRYHGTTLWGTLAGSRRDEALFLASVGAWIGASIAAALARRGHAALRWIAVSPLLLMLAIQGIGREGPLINSPGRLVRRNIERAGPDAVLVGDNRLAQALCWITRRDDVEVLGGAGEMAYGFEQTPGRSRLDGDGLRALIESSERPVVVLMERRDWERHRRRLPEPRSLDGENNFVLAEFAPRAGRSTPDGDPPLPAGDAGADHGSLRKGLGGGGREVSERDEPVSEILRADDELVEM